MDPRTEPAMWRATIRGYVERWRYAVDLQHDRIMQSGDTNTDEIDSHFMGVALKNLRGHVEWGRNYCDTIRDGPRSRRIADALRAYDNAVPDAANVRDIQEHVREYETGHKDRHLQNVTPPLATYFEHDGTTCIVHIGGYALDTAAAADAARTLADAALDALS
jgi:hypothetical protein